MSNFLRNDRIKSLSCWVGLSRVCLFVTLWTIPHQAPLCMVFSRPEYWSGLLLFPPPGDLPNQGIKLMFPALAGRFFTTSA